MILEQIYRQTVSVKKMIHVILTNDPSLRPKYVAIRRHILEALEESEPSVERRMTENAINRAAAAKAVVLPTDEIASELMYAIRNTTELPNNDLIEYPDYGLAMLRVMARDLVLMKRILRYTQTVDYSRFAGKVTAQLFEKASVKTNTRYQYKAYFPNAVKADGSKEGDRGIYKQPSYYGAWMVPISRTWFRTVAMRGLATTDIAGKAVMTVSEHKAPEQPAGDHEHIIVYKARVAFARKENKGKLVECTCWVNDNECTALRGVEGEDITDKYFESFAKMYNDFGIFLNKGKYLKNKFPKVDYNTWYIYRDDSLAVMPAPADMCKTSSGGARVRALGWQSAVIGRLQERYIAVYQPPGSSKRKVASGTSPLRSVSVLRNRLKDEVLDEIGVLF